MSHIIISFNSNPVRKEKAKNLASANAVLLHFFYLKPKEEILKEIIFVIIW